MNRISHILVVVDPSKAGRQAAVDKAALLAGCLGASVELVICDIEAAFHDWGVPLHALKRTPSDTQLLDLLDALAAPMRARGTEVTLRIIYGKSLHDSLLDYLCESNADLVIKDMHHHSFAERTFPRNTDWHLTRGCPTSLLLTKNKAWGRPPVIMAAVNPNHANERASALDRDILHTAASLAGRLTSNLHVIHTFIPTAFAAVVAAGGRGMTREYSEALQVENSFRYCQMEHLVSAYGVTQEHLHVEMGTPENCLAQAVTEYRTDVMVMGASSHGRWHRMVVGSTAATILESLPCDILIVRPMMRKPPHSDSPRIYSPHPVSAIPTSPARCRGIGNGGEPPMQSPSQKLRGYFSRAVLTLAIVGVAHAAPSSDASRLYAPCVVCHQPNAWGSPDGAIPNLAGQQKRYLERQLAVFRSGARVDTAMQIVAAHSTFSNPQNIAALANYLSRLDANPNPVEGSGEHLRVGQELYAHICAACHGVTGRGEPGNRVPRIAGQHFPYLRRQIEAAAALHKDLAPPEMTSALRSMRPQEMDALADYISRLGNSEALLDSNRPVGLGPVQPH